MKGLLVMNDLVMKKFDPISSQGGEATVSSDSGTAPTTTASGLPTPDKTVQQEDPSLSLAALAERMRRDQVGWLANFGISFIDRRFRLLRDQCRSLQTQVAGLPDDRASRLNFQSSVDDLEASYNRLRFRLVEVPSFLFMVVAIAVIGFAVFHSGLIDYIQDKLEIRRLMRYVAMAIAGALLWSLTSLMSRRRSRRPGHEDDISIGSVLVRALIAIVVPTIIVILTFKKGGAPLSFGQMWKSPEVWSFLAGYSCQLIILALNKLVEKVTKMIESL